MISVLAGPEGEVRSLRWSKADKAWKNSSEVAEGPIFRVCAMDFWTAQAVLDQAVPAVERIRKALEASLISIDDDKAAAAKWLEHPKARMVNGLFDLALEMAAGE